MPLQAGGEDVRHCSSRPTREEGRHTELLLDDLQNLLLVKLLWKTLNSGQSLTTIALCSIYGKHVADFE